MNFIVLNGIALCVFVMFKMIKMHKVNKLNEKTKLFFIICLSNLLKKNI